MDTLLATLPDEVRALIAPHAAPSAEMLDAISAAIAGKRDDAKKARQASGIEEIWRAAEEAYVGIDESNRIEFQAARWAKPMAIDGPVTTGLQPRQTDYRSTAYIGLTSRYVDAGAAKLGEILLPIDDKAFSFSSTPVPELTKALEDESQVVHEQLGPLTRPARPEELQTGPPGMSPPPAGPVPAPVGGAVPLAGAAAPAMAPPPEVPLRVKDLAQEKLDLATKAAEAAENRIYDWHIECQRRAEVRKVIFDASRIGVGVLKGPIPSEVKGRALRRTEDGGIDLIIVNRIKPASRWVDPWNIFPDPACGENIHDGDYILERDYLTPRKLRGLKNIPGYIGSQIDKVLKEGPNKINLNEDGGANGNLHDDRQDGRYEVWYWYGSLNREEMDCICGAAGMAPSESAAKEVFAIVTLVNDSVIRATINPLDSGSFPYHSMPWQRRAGHWAGRGVAEQITVPQRMLNAATRAMLNNAGQSAGVQTIIDQAAIVPADSSWVITPGKIWYKKGDSGYDDVRKAFMTVEIPNVTDQMMVINNYARQLAEEVTSIPLITQGQSGATTPDTFGATQLQNNNANQLLRSIAYTFDEYITEPETRMYYEWLLLDPDVPDEEKGDFQIDAHGSAALVERAIQDQTIAQLAGVVLDPRYGLSPELWAKLYLKSKHINPKEMELTEEEKQAAAQAQAQPAAPADNTLEAAKIKAAADEKRFGLQAQIEQAKIALEEREIGADVTLRLRELEQQREIELLKLANAGKISVAQMQAMLAKEAMGINAQKELSRRGGRGPQVTRPPTEPAGRAPDGQAYQA